LKAFLFLILFGGLIVYSSCTHETTLQPDLQETVYFDTQVLPIFQNTCGVSGCHNSGTRKEGYDLSNYASIVSKGIVPGEASNSLIYKTITGDAKLMPPDNPLSIDQRTLIKLWIDQGASETFDPEANADTVVTDTTVTDSTGSGAPFCFSRDVHPILTSNCGTSGCHDAATHEEGYNFTSYETTISRGVVSGNANQSKIYKVITTSKNEDDFMPPSPRSALTNDQISAIRKWINEGLKNEECAVQCDSNSFDFITNISPLIKTYCQGCHQASSSNGGVILETEAQIKAIANDGRLVNTLNATNGFSKMPPVNNLTSCEIEQITNWVNSLSQ
jgi:uncharacterized membrane protein